LLSVVAGVSGASVIESKGTDHSCDNMDSASSTVEEEALEYRCKQKPVKQ